MQIDLVRIHVSSSCPLKYYLNKKIIAELLLQCSSKFSDLFSLCINKSVSSQFLCLPKIFFLALTKTNISVRAKGFVWVIRNERCTFNLGAEFPNSLRTVSFRCFMILFYREKLLNVFKQALFFTGCKMKRNRLQLLHGRYVRCGACTYRHFQEGRS